MLIDLHVHSSYSDGFEATLAEIAEKCRAHGITAALLAECDVIPDLDEVAKASEELGFKFFVGVDIDGADGGEWISPDNVSEHMGQGGMSKSFVTVRQLKSCLP